MLVCICRDFQDVDENLLSPVIEALEPIANITVESQVYRQTFFLYMHPNLSVRLLYG